jgi:hypothetical protein
MWNGQPSPITEEMWRRLLVALDAGAPPHLACQYAGLGYETWLTECRRVPEFAIEAEKVSASGVVACLRFIQATGAGEWRAASEFVKLVRPELFGSSRTREAPRVDEPGVTDEPDADVTPDDVAAVIRILRAHGGGGGAGDLDAAAGGEEPVHRGSSNGKAGGAAGGDGG